MDNVIFAAFLQLAAQKLGMPVIQFASWLHKSLVSYLMEASSFDMHGLMDALKMDSYVICDGKEGRAYVGDRCSRYAPSSEKPMIISWSPDLTFLRYGMLSSIPFEVDIMAIPSDISQIKPVFDVLSSFKVKHLIIEEGRTKIDSHTFSWGEMETVTLPEGLERIEKKAFYHCTNLKEINIPASLRVVEEGSFEKCESLPEDVREQLIAIGGEKVFGKKENKE